MAHLKKYIIEVKDTVNCLAHSLIISVAKVNIDPKYESYLIGNKIRPVIRNLLQTTSVDLPKGAGILELDRFQEHFREYKISVCQCFSYENILFEGQVESSKRLNLIYDYVERHYHVMTKPTSGKAKPYVCSACFNVV